MGATTLVLGIGNVLWADEGFGVRAVSALHEGWRFPEEVELADGGTQGLYLLPRVQSARRLLVLDAIDYGLAPGTLKVVRGNDIPAYLGVGKMSLHQTSFQELLALASLTGWTPEDTALVGVQPADLRDFGGSLTPVVKARLPEALGRALEILAEWGVPGVARREPPAEPLLGPGLGIVEYESGRPSEEAACRIGDARVLAQRHREPG